VPSGEHRVLVLVVPGGPGLIRSGRRWSGGGIAPVNSGPTSVFFKPKIFLLGFNFFENFSLEILNFFLSAPDFAPYFIFFEVFTGGNEHRTIKFGIFQGFGVKIGVSKIFRFSKFVQNRRCFFANKKKFFDDGAVFCP